jgi:hypothetical protein
MPFSIYHRVKNRLAHTAYLALLPIVPTLREVRDATKKENQKRPSRTDILNYLLEICQRISGTNETSYLEIGVRIPTANFSSIKAFRKFGVDPGIEVPSQDVDFHMTSDEFFKKLDGGEVLSSEIRFDVVFVDGLHLAEQVDRDVANALRFTKDHGFVVLHDCNPPTEWFAREQYHFFRDHSRNCWNGSTWKAFLKWRSVSSISSCCIDTDFGVGILSKSFSLGAPNTSPNPFFEYQVLSNNRTAMLNLISFDELQRIVEAVLTPSP